jgi:hypothetical protein
MAIEFTIVDVWLGSFETEAALSAYLAETYSEDAEETPISAFAADQGQWFYDHDFVEQAFFDRTTDLRAALADCSFASSYIDDVVAAYNAADLPAANTVLLVFGAAIRRPRSASAPGYRLQHMGRFKSDPGV